MANTESISGVHTFVLYGKETALNTEQTTVNKHFGLVKNFNAKLSNNASYNRGFVGTTTGGRNVAKIKNGVRSFEETITMNVLNWDFLEFVLGAASGSGTITYSEADVPPSMTLHRCIDNPGSSATDEDAIWTGSVVDSVTIRCSVGQPVEVVTNLKSMYRKNDTTILSQVALPGDDVFTFAGADIELPNGTSLPNIIDSVEITISNNFKSIPGLGSVAPKSMQPTMRDYKIRFTVKNLDSDLVEAVQGAAAPTDTTEATEYATIECNFVNGGDSCALLFSTFKFDDHSDNEELNELVSEELSGTAESCTATEVQA